MTVIAELITVFGFEVDQSAIRDVEKAFDNLEKTALAVAGAFAAIGASIGAAIYSTVTAGEKALITAQRLGATVEGIQALQGAANLAGVDANAMTGALERLSKAAYSSTIATKSQAAKAFHDLGINVRDTNGHLKASDVLFSEVARAIAEMKPGSEQSAIAMTIMGRSAGVLLPLLKKGADGLEQLEAQARATGYIMSEETAVAAHELTVNSKVLGMEVDGLIRRFGAGLIPIVQKVANTIQAFWVKNRALIEQKVDLWAARVSTAIEYLYYGLRYLVVVAGDIIDYFGTARTIMLAFGSAVGLIVAAQVGALVLAIGGLIAAVGALGVTTLLTAAIPIALGLGFLVLAGLFFLVKQDLQATDSLIKKLLQNGIDPRSSPLVKILETLVILMDDVIKRAGILGNFFTGKTTGGSVDQDIEGSDFRNAKNAYNKAVASGDKAAADAAALKLAGAGILGGANALASPAWFDSFSQNQELDHPRILLRSGNNEFDPSTATYHITVENHFTGDVNDPAAIAAYAAKGSEKGVKDGISKNKGGPL